MDKQELLERYWALGEESDFLAAQPLYEQARLVADDPLDRRERLISSRGRRPSSTRGAPRPVPAATQQVTWNSPTALPSVSFQIPIT
jgi:hypothetical protein